MYKYYNAINFVLSLPWNQETIFGWMGLIILGIIGGATYVVLNSLFMLLFSSICNFHKVFYMNSKHLIDKLNEMTNVESFKPADHVKIASLLCEIMKNVNKGKE